MPSGVIAFTDAISRVAVELFTLKRLCLEARFVRVVCLRRANNSKLVHEFCDVADDRKRRAEPE